MQPDQDEIQWHYIKDDQQFGPIPQSELIQLFQNGILGPMTSVWNPRLDNWKPARDVPDLVSRIRMPATGPAPLAPPLSSRRYPAAVIAFGVLNIIIGFSSWPTIPAIVMLLCQTEPDAQTAGISEPWFKVLVVGIVAVKLIVGVCVLASGVGLLMLKAWARKLAVTLAGIGLVFGVIATCFSVLAIGIGPPNPAIYAITALASATLIYPILLMVFMRRPNVIKACNK